MNNDNLRSDLKELRVCIIIPTYNNEGTIAQVIEAACACCEDVIVVNDGATDGTAENSVAAQINKLDAGLYGRRSTCGGHNGLLHRQQHHYSAQH
mgnify:CR=1 FL=1